MPPVGSILEFSGGLGIVPPPPAPPPEIVNVPPVAGPPDIIGGPVTSSVAGAIFAFWNSRGDLRSLISGNLWTGEAPATVLAMPYAVLIQVHDAQIDRTTGFKLFRGMYQFTVMADNLTDADSLCQSVADAYDEAILALDGFVSCLAGGTRWFLGKGLGLGGDDCWTCYVELEIMYTR